MSLEPEEELYRKIKLLNERVWERRADRQAIDDWLGNFDDQHCGTSQSLHGLYLLSHFMYFGSREIRELLKALFRDLYKYPIDAKFRRANSNTTDGVLLARLFGDELRRTRFLGMGNPAESGSYLLYFFRQENRLPVSAFISPHQIFSPMASGTRVGLRWRDVTRYVFIDDFCGSGHQAEEYSASLLAGIKELALQIGSSVRFSYFVLFATIGGLEHVRTNTLFDDIACVMELDESYSCFGATSRYFRDDPPICARSEVEAMCRHYGANLVPQYPVGYDDGQLLIGFHHNVPDNTLPIVWFDEEEGPAWKPIFRRYPKYYGWFAP